MTFAEMYIAAMAGLIAVAWLLSFVMDYLHDAFTG